MDWILAGFQELLGMVLNFFTFLANNFIANPIGVSLIAIWLMKVFTKVRAGISKRFDTGWLALVDDIISVILLATAAAGKGFTSFMALVAYFLIWGRLYTNSFPTWNAVWKEKVMDDLMALALVGLGSLIIFNAATGGQVADSVIRFFIESTGF